MASEVVLVVEDEALVRLTAADALRDAGYRVVEAENADEALRILKRRDDISVVYTDVAMPGSIDGLRLAHYIATRWPPIRLLVSSGHVHVTDEQLPAGARFCAKPCPPEMIQQKIASLLAEGPPSP